MLPSMFLWAQEEVVVNGVRYSPMRLWSLEARTSKTTRYDNEKNKSEFGRRCRIYMYIKSIGTDPSEIGMKYSDLRKWLTNWMKERTKEPLTRVTT